MNDSNRLYQGEDYEPETKSPEMQKFLDEMSLNMFGRSRSLAKAGKSCVCCGKPARKFEDQASYKEFNITGFCQECQDKVFKETDEN